MIVPAVQENTVRLNTTDPSQEKAMQVTLSPEAFRILSSDLYKNKVRAIIRELSTNAWDSHVEAGTQDKNFDLQLPTYLEPIFRIRDYGTGLSEKDVFEIYNNLFRSTKTHTNEATGMLGLGSKTPFAYTDQLTLTSYQDGVVKIYNCRKNAGIPSTTLTYTGDTDEPNGLEIQFAVQEKDSWKFEEEAKSVFLTFMRGPGPNFLNTTLDIAEIRSGLTKIADNIYTKEGRRYGDPGLYVIQGNVAYPVEQTYLPEDHKNSIGRIDDDNLTFYLEVPIGTVKFTPSREALDESEENYKMLIPFLEGLEEHFMEYFRTQWSHIETDFHAAYLLGAPSGKAGEFYSEHYLKLLLKELGINQRSFYWSSDDITHLFEALDIEIKASRRCSEGIYKENRRNFTVKPPTESVHLCTRNAWYGASKTAIVVVDQTKRYRSRVKSYFAGDPITLIILKKAHAEPKALAEFLAMFSDLPTIVYASKLPDVNPPSRPRRKPVRYRWFARQGNSMVAYNLKTLNTLGVDTSKTFYYIDPRERLSYKAVELADNLDIIDKELVVTFSDKRTAEQVTKAYPKAVSFKDTVEAYFKKNYTEDVIIKEAEMSELLTSHNCKEWFQMMFNHLPKNQWSKYSGGVEYKKFLTKSTKAEYIGLVKEMKILQTVFSSSHDLTSATSYLDTVKDDIVKKLPLIDCISNYRITGLIRDNILQLLKNRRRK